MEGWKEVREGRKEVRDGKNNRGRDGRKEGRRE